MDSHAQEEIRSYATVIGQKIVAVWCPLAWEAFVDYELESISLSKLEKRIVRLLSAGERSAAIAELENAGLLKKTAEGLARNRERAELEEKLRLFCIDIPWL